MISKSLSVTKVLHYRKAFIRSFLPTGTRLKNEMYQAFVPYSSRRGKMQVRRSLLFRRGGLSPCIILRSTIFVLVFFFCDT